MCMSQSHGRSGMGLRFCITDQFPGYVEAAGTSPGIRCQTPVVQEAAVGIMENHFHIHLVSGCLPGGCQKATQLMYIYQLAPSRHGQTVSKRLRIVNYLTRSSSLIFSFVFLNCNTTHVILPTLQKPASSWRALQSFCFCF